MMKTRLALTLVAALAGTATTAASQGSGSIIGLWSTSNPGGKVELYRCGTAICGKIADATILRANPDQRDTKNPDKTLRDRRLKGLVVLHGFEGGAREWKGGPLYDPESGQGAGKGTLTLRADGKLEVKGCKAALFCQTKVWTRAR